MQNQSCKTNLPEPACSQPASCQVGIGSPRPTFATTGLEQILLPCRFRATKAKLRTSPNFRHKEQGLISLLCLATPSTWDSRALGTDTAALLSSLLGHRPDPFMQEGRARGRNAPRPTVPTVQQKWPPLVQQKATNVSSTVLVMQRNTEMEISLGKQDQ